MGQDGDDTWDVHETGYVAGGSAGPVQDTQVHAATTNTADDALPRQHLPFVRRETGEAVPNVRASVRTQEEVEAERAAIQAEKTRRVRPRIIAAVVAGVTLMFGGFVVMVVVGLVLVLMPSQSSSDPSELDGVPVRQHLGGQ